MGIKNSNCSPRMHKSLKNLLALLVEIADPVYVEALARGVRKSRSKIEFWQCLLPPEEDDEDDFDDSSDEDFFADDFRRFN